jgi:hypothetical protein
MTGLSTEKFTGIAAAIHQRHLGLLVRARSRGNNIALGFVPIALAYLRLNTSQAALAEFFATS